MLSNKKINPIVIELFIRGRKLNMYCFYYTILFFCVKNIRLNSTHCFIMKNLSKQELQQIVILYKRNVLQNHILF